MWDADGTRPATTSDREVAMTALHASPARDDHRTPAFTVMQRMFDEGFATGDTSVVDELCSPDLVDHQFGMAGAGAQAVQNVKNAMRDLHAMVPDMSFSIEDSVQDGQTIWVRVRAQGTATGPFFGPPSGQPIDITVIDIARIVDGRIIEHWGVPDRFAMLAQTGVLDRLA
jgi:predicted ester cyclase